MDISDTGYGIHWARNARRRMRIVRYGCCAVLYGCDGMRDDDEKNQKKTDKPKCGIQPVGITNGRERNEANKSMRKNVS